MKTRIYLEEIKKDNLLAEVDLEVVPRGLYVIDGIEYEYVGQPKFTIDEQDTRRTSTSHVLSLVELVVSHHEREGKPTGVPGVFRGPA